MAQFKLKDSNPEVLIDEAFLNLGAQPRGIVMRLSRQAGLMDIRPNFISAIISENNGNRVLTIVTRDNNTVVLTFEPVI